jgi:hypothetical protein
MLVAASRIHGLLLGVASADAPTTMLSEATQVLYARRMPVTFVVLILRTQVKLPI